MIKLTNVEKTYPDFHLNCSLDVPKGYITALIGPNGAGKSTTFKMILGAAYPDSGDLEVFGKSYKDITLQDKAKIGIAMSGTGFSGYLSINDIVPVLQKIYPKFDKEVFLKLCQKFDLPLQKDIKEFSTGMKAKLRVLSAICHEAELLILDEPTAGLDVVARTEILDMLREYMLPGDRSILISSHISSDLEGLCDDMYLIDQGKIILHEEMDTLLDRYAVLKVTEEQYEKLDKTYILREKREGFGYALLTDQKQFYLENEPEIVIEKGNVDEVMMLMIKGETL